MGFTNDFSEEVWRTTHKYGEEKSISDTHRRVANAIASVEKDDIRKSFAEEFYRVMNEFKFCPAGRILANAGTHFKTTLFNCYTSPIPKYDADSIEGIMQTLLVQMLTLKSEGGWGHNFSWLRPRGSLIYGLGVESPGSVKYAEIFNKSSEIITAGSGKEHAGKHKGIIVKDKIRKGAQLAVLFDCHPDIEEFITAKRVPNKLDKFNVSVGSSDEFMDKVCRVDETGIDEQLDLVFPDTTFNKYKSEWDGDIYLWKSKGYPLVVHKSISVKYLWELIMRSTYDFNDPGLLWIDIANRTYLANYLNKRIIAANPCGEQTMPPASVCDLGSLVLTSFFIPGKSTWEESIDWCELRKCAKTGVIFLDNVNDYSQTPHEEYSESAKKMRRIGLGLMGWGSLLYLLGVRFGSDKAEDVKRKIMQVITYSATEQSIELAKTKGKFIGCENDKVANNVFWDQIKLPSELRDAIRKHGIRNSSLFSIQPNGNTGILMNIQSGGCEPIFLHEWVRTVIVQSIPEHIKKKCPKYFEGEFIETEMFKLSTEGKETILRGIDEFGTVWKIDKNRGLTKEVLCEDYAVKLLKELGNWNPNAEWAVTTDNLSVEDHIKDLAGFAAWIDAAISKTVNIPNDYPYEEFKKLYINAYKTGVIKGITTYRAGTMTNVLASTKLAFTTKFEKRGKELTADIYHVVIKGKPHTILVGISSAKPYEVLVIADKLKSSLATGKVIKRRKGWYDLHSLEGELIFENITTSCTSEEGNLTRFLSMCLRHNLPIDYVVDQINKFHGDINSFGKSIGRCLKKYIPENTVSAENCPECQSKLVYAEGCQRCPSCTYSKCG